MVGWEIYNLDKSRHQDKYLDNSFTNIKYGVVKLDGRKITTIVNWDMMVLKARRQQYMPTTTMSEPRDRTNVKVF